MAQSTLPAWIEDLFGDGREFIKKVADLELFEKQLDIAREAQAFQDSEAQARDTETRNLGGLSLGIDPTLLILGLLGFGAVVLLVRR